MALCKECGALLPMDYFLVGICQKCLDHPTEMDYDTTDLTAFTFLEDCDD